MRPHAIVAVLAFAGIVAALMQTLVIPLIDGPARSCCDTTPRNASWVITATLLAGAVATPVMGRLGDLYGKRRMLLVSLCLLVVGSVVVRPRDSLVPMIVGRALQGFGMGVIPLGISLMRDVLPPEKLGSADRADERLASASAAPSACRSPRPSPSTPTGTPCSGAPPGSAARRRVLIWLLVPGVPVARRRHASTSLGAHRPRRRPGLPAAGRLQGRRLGLDQRHHPRPVRRRRRRPARCGAGASCASSDPLVDLRTTARRRCCSPTSPRSGRRLRHVRRPCSSCPSCCSCPTATGYGLGQSMLAAGPVDGSRRASTMMVAAPLGAELSPRRGPQGHADQRRAGHRRRLRLVAGLMGSAWGLVLVSVCVLSSGVGLAYGSMPALIMGAVPRLGDGPRPTASTP